MRRTLPAIALLAFGAVLCACSDDDGGGPTTLSVAKTTTNSGDAQTGPGGEALPNALRVIVTDGGVAANGVTVSWATPNGGSFAPATSTTDANGIATTTWTLGGGGGAQTASASVNSASGSPVIFNATATAAPTITVGSGGAVFSPATITINAGESVQFIWATGATNHNVSPASGNATAIPSSLPGVQDAPFEFTTVFPSAGTFRFFCSVHGANPTPNVVTGMSGTITVN